MYDLVAKISNETTTQVSEHILPLALSLWQLGVLFDLFKILFLTG